MLSNPIISLQSNTVLQHTRHRHTCNEWGTGHQLLPLRTYPPDPNHSATCTSSPAHGRNAPPSSPAVHPSSTGSHPLPHLQPAVAGTVQGQGGGPLLGGQARLQPGAGGHQGRLLNGGRGRAGGRHRKRHTGHGGQWAGRVGGSRVSSRRPQHNTRRTRYRTCATCIEAVR